MKQLFQDPKAGTIQVVELPEPALRPGTLLVRNAFSVISAGTERNAISAARDSYLKTARARPDLVRRVLDTVKREGVLAAYHKVQGKLSEPQALGYSSAGMVVAVGPDAGDYFHIGDRVACCGAGIASHAETICVPVNLAARVPDGVPLDEAAFATLGAIALQGLRIGGPDLGEVGAVAGLGLIGQLAVQLLRANGCRVCGLDLDATRAKQALDQGAAWARGRRARPQPRGARPRRRATASTWRSSRRHPTARLRSSSPPNSAVNAAAWSSSAQRRWNSIAAPSTRRNSNSA